MLNLVYFYDTTFIESNQVISISSKKIGILKQRFNVLNRPSRYSLEKVPSVVLSCLRSSHVPSLNIPAPALQPAAADMERIDYPPQNVHLIGNAVRQNYIDLYI